MILVSCWFGRHSACIVTFCAFLVCSVGFYVLYAMAMPSREPGSVKKCGKYTTLMLEKKVTIVKLIESGHSQLDVAKEYNLSKQMVSTYVKYLVMILTVFKNDSKDVLLALEEALK